MIIVLVGLAGGTGVFLATIGRKVLKMYQENCRDVVSIVVIATSMAIAVYFGEGIKGVIQCNLIVILLAWVLYGFAAWWKAEWIFA